MSGGKVQLANQRYQTLKNDFCIVFDKNADIVQVPNDCSIQEKGYNFMSLEDVPNIQNVKIIDFVGVLISVGSTVELQLKSGEMKKKRSIIVAD